MVQANFAVSAALLTLILLVQWLHYPSFAFYDPKSFIEAMAFHQARISWVVVPLMLLELVLAIALVWRGPTLLTGASLAVVVTIWAVTFFVQVPLHNQLLAGKDLGLIQELVQGNWIRTGLWTLKLGLALGLLLPGLRLPA